MLTTFGKLVSALGHATWSVCERCRRQIGSANLETETMECHRCSAHSDHLLQVFRYQYQPAILARDIVWIVGHEVSGIATYIHNGHRVAYVFPRAITRQATMDKVRYHTCSCGSTISRAYRACSITCGMGLPVDAQEQENRTQEACHRSLRRRQKRQSRSSINFRKRFRPVASIAM